MLAKSQNLVKSFTFHQEFNCTATVPCTILWLLSGCRAATPLTWPHVCRDLDSMMLIWLERCSDATTFIALKACFRLLVLFFWCASRVFFFIVQLFWKRITITKMFYSAIVLKTHYTIIHRPAPAEAAAAPQPAPACRQGLHSRAISYVRLFLFCFWVENIVDRSLKRETRKYRNYYGIL